MQYQYDVLVVGGGVVGCATAMELTKYTLRTAVLEAEEDVCSGTSKANSAIIHAGFDAPNGSLQARFNVEGSRLMPALAARLDIPYRRNGALVLCFSEAERPGVEALLRRGEKNGVRGLRIVERDELRDMEPNASPEAVCALFAPESAIVCPFEMTAAMAENAVRNGAAFFFDTPAQRVIRQGELWRVETPRGTFTAPVVVNAAGLFGGMLHEQACGRPVRLIPRKGEYCLLDRKAGSLLTHTLFQLPTAMGKGVLATPTVHGNILVGPTAMDVEDPHDTATTAQGMAEVLTRSRRSVPTLPTGLVITGFAGLRAHPDREDADFIIGEAPGAPGFFDAIGIESPGLSSAPAIAAFLAEGAAYLLAAGPNRAYDGGRDKVIRPAELSFEERADLIRREPAYGNILCRCEQVSEGEIVAAIHRTPGARSLDGVKRRTRAGMGRCQGGFCAPRVLDILSRELGVPVESLTKSGGESLPVVGHSREGEDRA